MGNVYLPSGHSVWVDELNGTINLSQLINDMKSEDFTSSYRISIISAVGKLGKSGRDALQCLKEIAKSRHTEKMRLVAEAADQAIDKIQNSLDKRATKQDWYPKPEELALGSATYRDNRPNRHLDEKVSHCATNYGSSTSLKKPDYNKVVITPLEVSDDLADGLKAYGRCNFCEKITLVSHHRRYSDYLAGKDKFYCPFCIRNDYYNRFNKNIFILTFRGIIGYYYYSYYAFPKTQQMYFVDLTDHIDLHAKVGLQNPMFRYDSETLCWFIDFSKIGKAKQRVPVECILETIVEILASFNLYENVKGCSPRKLFAKYREGVEAFCETRTRLGGDKVFAPTLLGCDIPTVCAVGQKAIPVDYLQGFIPSHLQDVNQFNRGKKLT